MLSMNEWTCSGRVVYLKELEGDYALSVRLQGEANRADGVYKSGRLEFGCILKGDVYEEAKKKGLKMGKTVCFSGHIETWDKTVHGKPANKVMFIADYVLEVA